ncbi:MAG: SDR family NAD(P)-dependent oxidoreductase [Bacteriovoracia bacterium]
METKKAIVTGASEGIGRAIALKLGQAGYQVCGVARNKERLNELKLELGDRALECEIADLSSQKGVADLANYLKTQKFDLLVNNAGYGVYGDFAKTPYEKLKNMMELNCFALTELSHAYLEGAKPGDALMNVASTLAFLPFPYGSVYAATKAFVVSLSESLWYEQKEKNVYVCALCPGATSTRFHAYAGGDKQSAPPKAILQTPEQVADVALSALKSRCDPTVISGFKNATMIFGTRLMSRKTTVSMMGKIASKEVQQ